MSLGRHQSPLRFIQFIGSTCAKSMAPFANAQVPKNRFGFSAFSRSKSRLLATRLASELPFAGSRNPLGVSYARSYPQGSVKWKDNKAHLNSSPRSLSFKMFGKGRNPGSFTLSSRVCFFGFPLRLTIFNKYEKIHTCSLKLIGIRAEPLSLQSNEGGLHLTQFVLEGIGSLGTISFQLDRI